MPGGRPPKNNEFRLDGEYAFVRLTQGQETRILAANLSEVLEFGRWYARLAKKAGVFYALTNGRSVITPKTTLLHSFLMKAMPGQIVDHKDRDTLNNVLSNLRFATNQQNCCNRGQSRANTSGFRGVYWNKRQFRFMSGLWKDGKLIFLGYFETAEEAARVYDAAAKKLRGDFAGLLNFPEQQAEKAA